MHTFKYGLVIIDICVLITKWCLVIPHINMCANIEIWFGNSLYRCAYDQIRFGDHRNSLYEFRNSNKVWRFLICVQTNKCTLLPTNCLILFHVFLLLWKLTCWYPEREGGPREVLDYSYFFSMVGRFCSDDTRFWDCQSDWDSVLCIIMIWLILFCRKNQFVSITFSLRDTWIYNWYNCSAKCIIKQFLGILY